MSPLSQVAILVILSTPLLANQHHVDPDLSINVISSTPFPNDHGGVISHSAGFASSGSFAHSSSFSSSGSGAYSSSGHPGGFISGGGVTLNGLPAGQTNGIHGLGTFSASSISSDGKGGATTGIITANNGQVSKILDQSGLVADFRNFGPLPDFFKTIPNNLRFWWMAPNSPFALAYDAFKNCIPGSACAVPPWNYADQFLSHLKTLKLPTNGCNENGCSFTKTYSLNDKQGGSNVQFSSVSNKFDLSHNPFLNGQVQLPLAGSSYSSHGTIGQGNSPCNGQPGSPCAGGAPTVTYTQFSTQPKPSCGGQSGSPCASGASTGTYSQASTTGYVAAACNGQPGGVCAGNGPVTGTRPTGPIDISKNPFLNGQVPSPPVEGCTGAPGSPCSKPVHQQSGCSSAGGCTSTTTINLQNNPFLTGGIKPEKIQPGPQQPIDLSSNPFLNVNKPSTYPTQAQGTAPTYPQQSQGIPNQYPQPVSGTPSQHPPKPQVPSNSYPQAPQGSPNPYPQQPQGTKNPHAPNPQGSSSSYPQQPQGSPNPYPQQPQGSPNPYPQQPQGSPNPYPQQQQGSPNPYPQQPQQPQGSPSPYPQQTPGSPTQYPQQPTGQPQHTGSIPTTYPQQPQGKPQQGSPIGQNYPTQSIPTTYPQKPSNQQGYPSPTPQQPQGTPNYQQQPQGTPNFPQQPQGTPQKPHATVQQQLGFPNQALQPFPTTYPNGQAAKPQQNPHNQQASQYPQQHQESPFDYPQQPQNSPFPQAVQIGTTYPKPSQPQQTFPTDYTGKGQPGDSQPFPSEGPQSPCNQAGYVCVAKSQCVNGVVKNDAGLRQTRFGPQSCSIASETCCRMPNAPKDKPFKTVSEESYQKVGSFENSASTGSVYYTNSGNEVPQASVGTPVATQYVSQSTTPSYSTGGLFDDRSSNNDGLIHIPPNPSIPTYTGNPSVSSKKTPGYLPPKPTPISRTPDIPELFPPYDTEGSGPSEVTQRIPTPPSPRPTPTPAVYVPPKVVQPRPTPPAFNPPPPTDSSILYIKTTKTPQVYTPRPPQTYLPSIIPEGSDIDNSKVLLPKIPQITGSTDNSVDIFRPENSTPHPGCAAALKCVPFELCTAEGVISNTTVYLTREQNENRVPLSDCTDIDTGIIGKCCRDPTYKDPWPVGQLGLWNPNNGFDDGSYKSDVNGKYKNVGGVKGQIPQGQFPGNNGQFNNGPFINQRPTNQGPLTNTRFGEPTPNNNQGPLGNPNNNIPNNQGFTNDLGNNDQFNQNPFSTPGGNPFGDGTTLEAIQTGIPNQNNYQVAPSGNCGVRHRESKPPGNTPLDTAFGEIPWQAMILREANRSLLCGGAIIRPDAVLTAAHCVENLLAGDVLVKGGEWRLGIDEEPKPFQIVKVAAIIRHPQYVAETQFNDVAILFLAERFRLDRHIDTICLPGANEQIEVKYASANCITTGWGKEVLRIHIQNSLMHHMEMSFIQPSQCQASLSQSFPANYYQYNENSCICAAPRQTFHDVCDVDQGSALACDLGDGHYQLAGIYSWDTGCAAGNQIASFVRLDVTWIQSQLQTPINQLIQAGNNRYTVTSLPQQQFQNRGGVKGGVKGGNYVGNQFGQTQIYNPNPAGHVHDNGKPCDCDRG